MTAAVLYLYAFRGHPRLLELSTRGNLRLLSTSQGNAEVWQSLLHSTGWRDISSIYTRPGIGSEIGLSPLDYLL